jgi:hypothetical protein
MRGVQNLEGGSVTSNRDSSLTPQQSIHSTIRVVAQQEIERQNFRVRGSGGECCISECLICGEWDVGWGGGGPLRDHLRQRGRGVRRAGLTWETNYWNGLFLPKGTPERIAQKLHDAVMATIDSLPVQA